MYNLGVQPLAIFSLSPCSFKMSHDKSSHVGLYAYKHFDTKKYSGSRYVFLTRAFFIKTTMQVFYVLKGNSLYNAHLHNYLQFNQRHFVA